MATRLAALLLILCAPAAQAEWLYREAAIMGTRCAVEVWAAEAARGEQAIEAVFADMRRIDRLMSTYRPDSELSRVNAEAATRPVPVSQELYDLVATAQQYSALSQGAFDITYASVGYLYDYRQRQRPDDAAIAAALPGVDYRQLKLDPVARTIAFGRPGMRIDLGGIAKGHAVDRGIAILRQHGFGRAMVNAGGDTRVAGDRFGKPWMVGIRDPDRSDRVVLRVPLQDAAFSTSGDYERYFDEGGERHHHIINPRTGRSPHALRSVTIIASNATRTDGLSKTVFILGAEAGLRFINAQPDADAVVIDAAGKVHYSAGLAPPALPAVR
ncbi:MAG: hypothetical protein RL026_700 [Pseudomonadota bacterium]|jgi:thiamine biosynthesis lipoprotein